jgi:hypothetical protein
MGTGQGFDAACTAKWFGEPSSYDQRLIGKIRVMKNIKIVPQTQGRQIIYEYGIRVDAESEQAIAEQICKARAMYNNIIAVMRGIYDEMQAFVLERAPQEARDLVQRIEQHGVDFKDAKARDDRPAMLEIARARREDRKTLYPLLQEVRKAYRTEIAERFYSRIGMNSRCDTYACRGVAVKDGLGAFTANKGRLEKPHRACVFDRISGSQMALG